MWPFAPGESPVLYHPRKLRWPKTRTFPSGCLTPKEKSKNWITLLKQVSDPHSIENWDWYGKTSEEFFEHLFRLWVKQDQVKNTIDSI